MKQENKTKSVKKFSVKMLLAMVFGGVLGGFFGVGRGVQADDQPD